MSAQPIQRSVGAEHAGRTCPYCRFTFKDGVQAVECGSCHASHHLECWQDNQGCAVLGCPSAPSGVPPGTDAAPIATGGPTSRPAVAAAAAGSAPLPPDAAVSAPSVSEFAGQVRSWLSTPAAMAAGEAALTALALMAAVALLLAVVTPDEALLGRAGAGTGLFKEFVRDVVGMTQARYGFGAFTVTLLPVAFLLVPIAGVALGVRRTAPRLADLPGRQRLLIAMATGVPLAVLLLIVSAFAGESGAGFSAGTVILYALLWGAVGGVIGLSRVVGRSALSTEFGALPATPARWLRIVGATLRPLLALLLVGAVLGVTAWEVQILRGQDTAKFGRGTATALIETPFLFGEDAIQGAGLGALAKFQPLGEDSVALLALPPDDDRDLTAFSKHYRVFAYHAAYAVPVFIIVLVALLGGALVTGLFAGFGAATAAGARKPRMAAAYGASAGLVWALAMALLRAIADLQTVSGTSLFGAMLLVGCVLGAVGGVIAVSSPGTAAAVENG